MPYVQGDHVIKEAVAVFDAPDDLFAAIDAIRNAGFSRADISVLADEKAIEAKLHDAFWKAEELEDNPEAPRRAYISEEAFGAAEGALIGAPLYVGAFIALGAIAAPALPLSAAVAALVVGGGAGAGLGALLAKRVGDRHAEYLKNQVRHGGLILWVRTDSDEKEKKALAVLNGLSAHDVHLNDWVPDS
ncbi:hypothetical protein [Histidinibacterium aquaticum]|uniref:DUF1269 domain-containing protein n=1 Tax=Histidinibacterium aquaticum TaxID=2613962 RepID=A0A5J5GAI3_9RHOB|nr:hypothetical protein [Histidinibacterium aquaticum]KAA9004991.1 hypothetical protein F3S47_18980 [Histidinibacterium aquaticum]